MVVGIRHELHQMCRGLPHLWPVRGGFRPTEMAMELAKSGPLAVQAARETLHGDLFAGFRAATEREAFMQNMLRETNDFKEGVKAGFDRREPVFTGT